MNADKENKIVLFEDFKPVFESEKKEDKSESKTDSKTDSKTEVLEKMANYIKRRFKNEDKILFTYWIGKIFEFTKYLIVSKLELSEYDQDVTHVYIKLDDKYYDGSGFHTKEDLYKEHNMSQYTFKDFTYNGDLNKVKKCLDSKDVKLNTNQVEELKHILEKYKDKLK
jgi:hypothetical protein